jgi:hypothetical protein
LRGFEAEQGWGCPKRKTPKNWALKAKEGLGTSGSITEVVVGFVEGNASDSGGVGFLNGIMQLGL